MTYIMQGVDFLGKLVGAIPEDDKNTNTIGPFQQYFVDASKHHRYQHRHPQPPKAGGK
jgi:hypothetical protein